jgi:pectate lyase
MSFGFAFVEGKGLKTTTGGKGGKKYEINGDVDEFHDLCEDLRKKKEPSIIILRGTFKLDPDDTSVFKIPSNCSIYGEGCTIIGGFEIKEQENVIIKNINFGLADRDTFDDEHDCMVIYTSHHVWVDHCNFVKCPDGCLDIKREASFVTISWCVFGKDQHKNMLIGHDNGHDEDEGNLKVTIHHCWYKSQTRNPRVRYGVVHVVNSLYDQNKVVGMGAAHHSTIHSEKNYFYKCAKPYDNNYGEEPKDRGVIYSVDDKLVDIRDLRVDEYKKENRLHELPYKNYPVDKVEKVKEIVEEGAGIIKDFKYRYDMEDDSSDESEDEESDDEESEDDFIKILKNIQKLNKKSDKNLKKIQKGKKKHSIQDLAEDARQYCSDINEIIDNFLKR